MEENRKEPNIDKLEFVNSFLKTRTYLVSSLTVLRDSIIDIDALASEIDGVSRNMEKVIRSEGDEKYIQEFSGYLDEIEGRIKPKISEMREQLDNLYDDITMMILRLDERFKERLSQVL